MIQNDAELQQTLEQLERMYRALGHLREQVLPKNPRMFAVMAEGPLDYIRQFQEEIDTYVGATRLEEQGDGAGTAEPFLVAELNGTGDRAIGGGRRGAP
jgi:hypothetical protein